MGVETVGPWEGAQVDLLQDIVAPFVWANHLQAVICW